MSENGNGPRRPGYTFKRHERKVALSVNIPESLAAHLNRVVYTVKMEGYSHTKGDLVAFAIGEFLIANPPAFIQQLKLPER